MSQRLRHLPAPVPYAERPENPEPGDECFQELVPGSPAAETRMTFCWCPPTPAEGFLMGSPETEEGRYERETPHRVVLTEGFWLGKHLVKQAQWQALMGGNPSKRGQGETHPVDSVSWLETKKFAEASQAVMLAGMELWLPTEAQWEWACRAGTTGPFGIGEGTSLNAQMANFDGDNPYGRDESAFPWLKRGKTLPVGRFPPNAWGLQDMHGQLWEWCRDWLGDYEKGLTPDPLGADEGGRRVLRGGYWLHGGRSARSAFRNGVVPELGNGYYGFRVCPSSIQSRAGGDPGVKRGTSGTKGTAERRR